MLLLLPGIGPAKASALCARLIAAADPLAALATAETMALVPAKSKGFFAGFVADLRKVEAAKPEIEPVGRDRRDPPRGLSRHRPRPKYERPDNRIADIEQLAVLAARYDSLERLIADLMLAGDVYGVDTLDGDDPTDHLVLSTIHQAKGLEWSRVFVPRLIEDSFPQRRALDEPGGEDEERRIFYVAVTRAMDELYLTYPLDDRRGQGRSVLIDPGPDA